MAENKPLQILVEIVSAMDLVPPYFDENKIPDAYCVLKLIDPQGDNETLHETKSFRKSFDPIWTVKSGSLYLMRTNEKDFMASDGLLFLVFHQDILGTKAFCHGSVKVPPSKIVESKGKRVEYPLMVKTQSNSQSQKFIQKGSLALRFRHATTEDIKFINKYQSTRGRLMSMRGRKSIVFSSNRKLMNNNGPLDFNFQEESPPLLIWKRQTSERETGEVKYMVKPFPDPKNPMKTKFLSKTELDKAALEPSHHWYSSGSGTKGTLHVEVISCHGLPNLDNPTGLVTEDVSDPFVAMIFEDVMVRTHVIHDELSPRWMPWTDRAFSFPISHPSNLLFVGVFDYDQGPLTTHDPIGRIVIDLSNFTTSTVYLVEYKLQFGPDGGNDDRGSIKLRIKLDLQNERQTLLASFITPPTCYINVDNHKSFKVLRFLCRGQINLEKATMQSTKLYAYELFSYLDTFLYAIDVMVRVLLWRGRKRIVIVKPNWIAKDKGQKKKGLSNVTGSVSKEYVVFDCWFPIHSIGLFVASTSAIEHPNLIPGLLLYGVAWVMFTIGYHSSNHPMPWVRCKSVSEISSVLIMGRNVHPPLSIQPNEGMQEAQVLKKLEEARTNRIRECLNAFKTAGLKFYKGYYKTDARASLETEDTEFVLFGEYLYYIHLMLKTYCNALRVFSNVISWRSSSKAYVVTVGSFLVGTVLMLIPLGSICFYTARIFAWTFLGPWMKLFDLYHMQNRYGRIHKEDDNVEEMKPINVDAYFDNPEMKKLAKMVRIAAEDALKLKEMRQLLYGDLSEVVPSVDTSRFPSIPLSTSISMSLDKDGNALGYSAKKTKPEELPGQRLQGKMIHVKSNDFYQDNDNISLDDDENISIQSDDSNNLLMN